jgi:DNA repair exonuclease SbcCD ATPase subunit
MQARSSQAVELAQELAAQRAALQEAAAHSAQEQELHQNEQHKWEAELEEARAERDAACSRLAELEELLQAEQKRVQALQHAAHAQHVGSMPHHSGLDSMAQFGMHSQGTHPLLAAAIDRLAAAAEAGARERHATQVLIIGCMHPFC